MTICFLFYKGSITCWLHV